MSLLLGINSVIEALRSSGTTIERICIQRGQRNPRMRKILELAAERRVVLSFEDKTWLDRKSGGERHQGVLAYVSEARTFSLEEVLTRASEPGLIVVLDGIEDPQNLGAILRSAEVAGADGVLLPQRRSAGLTPTAVKTSAGALAHLRLARVANTSSALGQLKDTGYWVAGLDAEAGEPLWRADFTVPTALVLGSEGGGLHRLVKERCDYLVSIPVRGRVSSYNVSVAAGIVLYEVIRQRAARHKG